MTEASVIGLLRWIAIFLLIYYGFKLISRYLAPILLKYIMKKTFQQNQGGKEKNDKSASQKRESKKSKLGEYVDYEEIKD